jgi:integrase
LITVPLGSGITGDRQRQRFTVKGNRTAAKKALREAMAKRDNGFGVAPDKITVGTWLDRWLPRHVVDKKLAPRAAERYDGIIKKHVTPALGAIKLQALRADHISDAKASWLDGTASTTPRALSGATVHKHLVVLRQACADAVKSGIITRNPVDTVQAPSVKLNTERRALSEDEITALITAAHGTRYDVPIRFTLATALREGELLALRWSDLDLDRSRLHVRQTLIYINGVVKFTPPKTKRSERAIELSPATVRLLRQHHAAQAERQLSLGTVWRKSGLVFPSLIGTPWLPRAFYRGFRDVVARAEVPDRNTLNWHCLRHTAASQWLRHGADVFSVSRRLGHASAAFTMDVYGHLLSGQQERAAAALDYLIAR